MQIINYNKAVFVLILFFPSFFIPLQGIYHEGDTLILIVSKPLENIGCTHWINIVYLITITLLSGWYKLKHPVLATVRSGLSQLKKFRLNLRCQTSTLYILS